MEMYKNATMEINEMEEVDVLTTSGDFGNNEGESNTGVDSVPIGHVTPVIPHIPGCKPVDAE
jgi:hypothetical protein